jgi:hypothetical protein
MNARLWLAPRLVDAFRIPTAPRRGRTRPVLMVALGLLGAVSTAAPAWAQDKEETEEKASDDSASEGSEGETSEEEGNEEGGEAEEDESGEKEGVKDKDSTLVADAEKGSSPVEDPGRTYHFVGARYRFIVVPAFMMRLFGDGGKTVGVHAFGPEFAIRKDAFEYNIGLWYAGYGMDPTPFKAKDDGEDAWELVESKIKVIYATVDFLWSHDFSPEFALNYGLAGGMGIVFGPLYRNQAYPALGGGYEACPREGFHPYCGTDNDHYNNYEEPSWTSSGSKPIIFPWLAVQTGFRYKAHRNFAARFDTGFGLSGFFFGVGADYGL